MKDITLSELNQKIQDAESQICKILRDFQNETDCDVGNIDLMHGSIVGKRNPIIMSVKLDVRY